MENPYRAPTSSGTSSAPVSNENVKIVIQGQKLLIYGIMAYICAGIIMVSANAFLGGTTEKPIVTPMFTVVLLLGIAGLLAAAICACVGIFRMGKVLFPGTTRYIYAIGVIIPAPLIGLIVMFVANSNATGFLKARGIKVGFLGAKR